MHSHKCKLMFLLGPAYDKLELNISDDIVLHKV